MSCSPGSFRWLCCTATLLSGLTAHAKDASSEQQLKASYILNFARYATWPGPETSSPLIICLAGADAGNIAVQLEKRAAGARPLQPRILARGDDANDCNALYLSAGVRLQSTLLARLRDQAVLTIGDSASFLAEGGIIHMMSAADGIHFEINLDAARRSGLSLHPRLLALAERVVGTAK